MHRSPYNSIPLCYTHHKEADSHNTDSPQSAEYRKRLRDYTYRRIERIGRIRDTYDTDYLNAYHKADTD